MMIEKYNYKIDLNYYYSCKSVHKIMKTKDPIISLCHESMEADLK